MSSTTDFPHYYENAEHGYCRVFRSAARPANFSAFHRPCSVLRDDPGSIDAAGNTVSLKVKTGDQGVVIFEEYSTEVPVFMVAFFHDSGHTTGFVDAHVLGIGYTAKYGQVSTTVSTLGGAHNPGTIPAPQQGQAVDRITGVYLTFIHSLSTQPAASAHVRPSFMADCTKIGIGNLAQAVAEGLVPDVRQLFNQPRLSLIHI